MSRRGCRMGGRVCRGWFGRRVRLGWGIGSPLLVDLGFSILKRDELACLGFGWTRSRARVWDG
jgi:hypothetical protein